MAQWLLVVVGAALGASLRYLLTARCKAGQDSLFPGGTFSVTVNVVGSLSSLKENRDGLVTYVFASAVLGQVVLASSGSGRGSHGD